MARNYLAGPKLQYEVVARAERTADIYGGESCDEHIARWTSYFDGDLEGGDSPADLVFNCERYPAGTKITVEIPICPECGQDAQLCQADEGCDFDWKQWAENRYT